MKKVVSWVIASLVLFTCSPAHAMSEAEYRDRDCARLHGQAETRNMDGTRTDCLTALASVEYDFAYKWYECLTQAMHYAMLNDNAAVCILIVRSEKEHKFYTRAIDLVDSYRLPITLQMIQ